MFQESEIVDLMLVGFLTPMLWIGVRSIRIAGKRRFIASYLAMVCAYIFTVLEGYVAPIVMNNLEHVSYAVSGIFLALGMRAFMRESRREAGMS